MLGSKQYDGKVRGFLKARLVTVSYNREIYLLIPEFVKENIEGILLREGETAIWLNCGCGKYQD